MENNNLKKRITLGLILITIGIFYFSSNYIKEKRELVFSQMNLELSTILAEDNLITSPPINEVPEEIPETEVPPQASEAVPPPAPVEVNNNYEPYLGVLDIPKIGFNKGFYKKESSLNNVKFNLKVIADSDYPDKENGNVIIIGHSGNYNNSYFANLYQLNLEDTASITYQGKKYNYKIVNIYTDNKDGTVTIYRNELKSCLTLITCTKDDETSQTIYILELINIE